MNAQAHIRKFQQVRNTHYNMLYAYQQRREALAQFKANWGRPTNLINIEAELQQMEHDLARFEWQHGIFSYRAHKRGKDARWQNGSGTSG